MKRITIEHKNQSGVVLVASMLVLIILTALVISSFNLNIEETRITGSYTQSSRNFLISDSVNSQVSNFGFNQENLDGFRGLFGGCNESLSNDLSSTALLLQGIQAQAQAGCLITIECETPGSICTALSGTPGVQADINVNNIAFADLLPAERTLITTYVDAINTATTVQPSNSVVPIPNFNVNRTAVELTLASIYNDTSANLNQNTGLFNINSSNLNSKPTICTFLINNKTQNQLSTGSTVTINSGVTIIGPNPNSC